MSKIGFSRISALCALGICIASSMGAQPAVPPKNRASLGVNIIPSEQGADVTVTRVGPNTPADQMGLRPGDRIQSVNGRPVGSLDEFVSTIRSMRPGDEVELRIIRGQTGERTLRGELDPYNDDRARAEQPTGDDEFRAYQEVINRDRWNTEEDSRTSEFLRDSQRSAEQAIDDERFNPENRQTSFEEGKGPKPAASGDLDARLSRIEEQLDRITQELGALRKQIGTGRLSGRDAGPELRPRTPPQPRPTDPQTTSRAIRQYDRWNVSENRYEQADLTGARERAAQEAARRRADALGTQLQQQERARTRNPQPPTEQLPADQPPPR
jgi:hypothetical protein